MASQGFRGTPAQLFAISLTRIDKNPDDRDINTEEQALAALNEGAGRGGPRARAAGAAAPASRSRSSGTASTGASRS